MDGIALLERTKEKYPDMPVVMVTAVHDISVALAAIRNGAYDYLLKPFEREQLLATVRRALENRRLKVENRAYQTNLEALVTARTEQLRQTMVGPGALLRHHPGSSRRRARLERRRNRGPLQARHRLHHRHGARHGTCPTTRSASSPAAPSCTTSARWPFRTPSCASPARLTPEEIAIMQEHCYRGYQMLRKIPFLTEAAEIVYSHQEKWDGTGYPRGLKGNEIPLGSRMFSIADTLDAIMSDRPYRAAQTFSAARDEIVRWSGRQFDPEVVKVFLTIPESIWHDLRKEIDQQIYRFTYSQKVVAKA